MHANVHLPVYHPRSGSDLRLELPRKDKLALVAKQDNNPKAIGILADVERMNSGSKRDIPLSENAQRICKNTNMRSSPSRLSVPKKCPDYSIELSRRGDGFEMIALSLLR